MIDAPTTAIPAPTPQHAPHAQKASSRMDLINAPHASKAALPVLMLLPAQPAPRDSSKTVVQSVRLASLSILFAVNAVMLLHVLPVEQNSIFRILIKLVKAANKNTEEDAITGAMKQHAIVRLLRSGIKKRKNVTLIQEITFLHMITMVVAIPIK